VAQDLWNIDLQRASQYARRAILLARQEDPRTIVWSDFHYVFTLPFFDQWRRDARAALTEIDSLAAGFGNSPDKYLAWRIGECYLALGRVDAARKWFNRTLPYDFREEGRVYTSYAEGDEQGARTRLALFQDGPKLGSDLLFIVPRLLPHPERLLPLQSVILGKQDGGPRHFPGEVALSQGRVDDAISSLQYTFDKYPGLRTEQMVAESLVKALELSDHQPKALEVLVEARRRDHTMQPIFWVRNLAHLAASYRKLGREPEAREIEDELRQLLAVADPDFYIVKQLHR
jgi:tetratricopeptide (TPR) repeat protein